MITQRAIRLTSPSSNSLFLFSVVVVAMIFGGMIFGGWSAEATSVPWECSNYTNEAQTRCLNAFIERQQEQIGQLEGRLHAQQEQVGQLKSQVDRQNAAASQFQQQLSQTPVTTGIVAPTFVYPYAYAYPPVGIGLYLGRPWMSPGFYGYYGRPYWGPRFFYRHHGRHW